MDLTQMQGQSGTAGLETSQSVVAQSGSLIPGNIGFTIQKGGTIGTEQVNKARQILNDYKEGKKNLEQKVIDAEQWYKLRNWECMRKDSKVENQVEPVSGWLFNAISNKHASAMDNYPMPNILPREEGDKQEAKKLSSIVPVLLEKCDFEQTYNDEVYDKLIGGTGIFGVFWDGGKLGGLGDVAIERVDVLSLFWQPGVNDIQQSRNLFHVVLRDNESLIDEYPELEGKLGKSSIDLGKYQYDDQVDTTDSSAVVDWYYRKRNTEGKVVLHYCKFINDTVLFATENDPNYAERGWYDHGMYPFVFDPLFPMKGTPCGFGFVDVAKSPQEYIDRGNQAILENMIANSRPRYFIRSDGSVNEEEFADTTKPFVHTDGGLAQDSIMPIQGKPLSGMKFISMIRGMNLQLFAEGAGDGSGTGVTAPAAGETAKGAKNPLANVVYGKQEGAPAAGEQAAEPEDNAADGSAETFDSLIKGKYKADFDRQVQDIVQKRLRGSKEMETALNGKISQMQNVLDELAQKYGVDGTNLEAITNAMHADDKFYEQEAQDKGMSVQQLRQIKNMERENESLRRQMRERSDREQAEAIYSKWMQDAETVKQQFPDFDLQKELENPQFASLLRANVDVATAFQVIHKDELIPAAMQYTARQVQNKMASSVAANNARPKENGIGNGASAIVKTDVSQLTKADRAEIARRVARGEKIRF